MNIISIQKLKENLKTFISKNILINQRGFIETYFQINNFDYKIEYELLKIYDKNSKNFIITNLNQVYNIIYTSEKIKLHLDNDTTISIEIKR